MSKGNPSQGQSHQVGTDLPEGWASCALGDAVSSSKGKKPQRLLEESRGGLIPYVDIRAFETGEYREFTAPQSGNVGSEGDLLIVWDGARSGLVGRMPCEGAVGSTLALLRPVMIDVNYLQLFLQSNFDFINSNTRGTGIPHVDPGVLWGLELPTAPLAEQKRIVAKVEELLKQVNAARARLAKLPAILKRFRQSVLAAACSGQLTAEWREGRCCSEPSEVLLKRLLHQREQSWARLWRTRYKHPADPDCSELPEHPDNWQVASMDQLTLAITSGSRAWSKYYGRGTGTFLMAQNVRPGRLDLSFRQPVDPPPDDRERVRSQVRKGDLLVTIVGANTGDVCPVTGNLPEHYVCQSVALMRPTDTALWGFLNLWLNSPAHGRKQYERYIYGEGRPHLSFDHLRMTPVAVPPLEEQREIVRRAESLFILADGIESHVRAATLRAERLPQAILARAFRGELVPTEAELAAKEGRDYEPASVLLERIRKAREQQKSTGIGRGGKKMATRSTGRKPTPNRRPLDEVLREQGKPLTPERLLELAGFDEDSVDYFYEKLRELIHVGKVRENRPNKKDVTLEATET
jgi:type I restriction enzyme S subunit